MATKTTAVVCSSSSASTASTTSQRKLGSYQYTDVANLSKKELKDICRHHNIGDLDHGKSALRVLVCELLKISTTGQTLKIEPRRKQHGFKPEMLKEFEKMSLAWASRLAGDTKQLHRCPEIDDAKVKGYLLDTNSISPAMARKYKLTRPYQLKSMVHSVKFNELRTSNYFCIVKGRCNPSQSTNEDDVKSLYCVIDKNRSIPVGGFCSCTAGQSQSCGHIGALLFTLADVISSGDATLPDDLTCTDVPCYWANPKGAAVEPKTIDSIQLKQGEKSQMRRTSTDYGQLFTNAIAPPTKDEVLQLRGDLINATLSLGKILPAVNALHASRFGPIKCSKGPVTLPDNVLELDASLAPAALCEVSTEPPLPPLPVALHPQVKDKINFEEFCFTDQECHLVEQATKGQSNNVLWYKQRMGAITSSVAFDISQSYLPHSRASKNRLANTCLHADYISLTKPPETKVESLRYGIEKEKVARTQYFNGMVKQHQDFNINETGLVVHPEKPFLRASPDGIAKCSCHSSRTIEIKCPFTARDMTVEEAVRTGKIDYLQQEQGGFVLSKTKRGYFCQVQMAMAITQQKECHFIVWTEHSYVVINVDFDPVYWTELEKKLVDFFSDYVFQAINHGPLPVHKTILGNLASHSNVQPGDQTVDDDTLQSTAISDVTSVNKENSNSKTTGPTNPRKRARVQHDPGPTNPRRRAQKESRVCRPPAWLKQYETG